MTFIDKIFNVSIHSRIPDGNQYKNSSENIGESFVCQLSTKRYVHFHTYVFKLKENGNGTFPSKVVSKPSKGNAKENLIVNVQSLVILGIKNRLCRDNNLCESESKSIKDWYASDETNTEVKTKNDEQLNHMTEQN